MVVVADIEAVGEVVAVRRGEHRGTRGDGLGLRKGGRQIAAHFAADGAFEIRFQRQPVRGREAAAGREQPQAAAVFELLLAFPMEAAADGHVVEPDDRHVLHGLGVHFQNARGKIAEREFEGRVGLGAVKAHEEQADGIDLGHGPQVPAASLTARSRGPHLTTGHQTRFSSVPAALSHVRPASTTSNSSSL